MLNSSNTLLFYIFTTDLFKPKFGCHWSLSSRME